MKSAKEVFTIYLSRHGLKITPQRMAILDVFEEEDGHLTSEELYERIKRLDPSIGQATVYRTLKLLAEAGLAKAVNFGDGVTRYEFCYGLTHHDHLICERCRRNIEVVDDDIERLQEELAKKHGFTLTRHKMYLYGVCPECRDKGRDED
ncbi:MAG: Fur family transcriptional regulator, ferric uptake regulator [Desulfovibrionales bacterium]|jgi:Fur family ferric uptake transcriptional regulator|nr:Fur family transcriptional regulator, ferric uptake regulator [Desulfovibrionales bacterium]